MPVSTADRLSVSTPVRAAYRRHLSEGWATLNALLGAGVETRAAGCFVYDEHDRPYLDCGGYGVYLLGHSHPRVVDAVCAQVRRRALPSRILLDGELAAAAQALAGVAPTGLEFVHLTTSGAEAAELALKLARVHGRHRIVSATGGFHGKTLGALSAAGDDGYRDPFAPLLPQTVRVPFGNAPALRRELADAPGRCAVLLEPVQGEGGVVVPPPGYLREVRALCDEHDALLVLDEVQTGLGRLGAWWGCAAEQVRPDVLLAGKALGGGVVPAGAVIATPEVYAPLSRDPFLHGSTFANSPLAAAAVRETLAVLQDEQLVDAAARLGDELLVSLRAIVARRCAAQVAAVRGRGLMLGIEWRRPELGGLFVMELLRRGVLVNVSLTGKRVSRLTPPAIMGAEQTALLLDALDTALAAVAESA
ncbi:MAG: aminotransferase class III-fold pyridoxal phosphate-dependent enzyme [Conexibacter sp.]